MSFSSHFFPPFLVLSSRLQMLPFALGEWNVIIGIHRASSGVLSPSLGGSAYYPGTLCVWILPHWSVVFPSLPNGGRLFQPKLIFYCCMLGLFPTCGSSSVQNLISKDFSSSTGNTCSSFLIIMASRKCSDYYKDFPTVSDPSWHPILEISPLVCNWRFWLISLKLIFYHYPLSTLFKKKLHITFMIYCAWNRESYLLVHKKYTKYIDCISWGQR